MAKSTIHTYPRDKQYQSDLSSKKRKGKYKSLLQL